MRIICLPLAVLVLLSACTLFRGTPKLPAEGVLPWQDGDSRQLASELSAQMLSEPWYAEFTSASHRAPVLAILVLKASPEGSFPQASLARAMENELVSAGIILVAGRDDPSAGITDDSTLAEMEFARSTGADYILKIVAADAEQDQQSPNHPAWHISARLVGVDSGKLAWFHDRVSTAGGGSSH